MANRNEHYCNENHLYFKAQDIRRLLEHNPEFLQITTRLHVVGHDGHPVSIFEAFASAVSGTNEVLPPEPTPPVEGIPCPWPCHMDEQMQEFLQKKG